MSQLIEIACQQSAGRKFTRLSRTYPMVLAGRLVYFLKNQGIRAALRRTVDFVSARLGTRPKTVTPANVDISLGLSPGDWVEVRSEGEILGTLDANLRCRGLSFLPNMRPHCGRRYRVFKRVENFFFEESKQKRKLKNTVLLEGVHCHGEGIGCDRSCFLFWREAWLRRVEGPLGFEDSKQ